jgi:hypothetical protein
MGQRIMNKVMWVPDEESRKLCVQYGRDFVKALKQ